MTLKEYLKLNAIAQITTQVVFIIMWLFLPLTAWNWLIVTGIVLAATLLSVCLCSLFEKFIL